jgi:hypothetical protein
LEDFASQASEIPLHGAATRISDEQLKELFKTKTFEEALDVCISKCTVEIQKKFPGNHINWFHEKKITSLLKKAGFNTVYRSAYGQSHAAVLRDLNYFDRTLPAVSMYIEAVK